jgi:hypothetical protein
VVFSGRQSPGGHNVIWGTYDAMKAQNPHNVLLGFVGENNVSVFEKCKRLRGIV